VRLVCCGCVPVLFLFLGGMASAAEMTEYVAKHADPDLAFILNDVGLDIKWQHDLVKEGYKSVRRLAALEDTTAAVRGAFKTMLTLDPDAAPGNRLALTMLVDAWSVAKVTAEKEIQAKAEAKVYGGAGSVLVNSTDQTSMRRAVETAAGNGELYRLPDDEVPAKCYVTDKLAEIEQNDPQATPLDQITHLEHATEIDLAIGLDRSGAFRTVRKKGKVDTPNDPEAYRKRMRVETTLWLMLAAKSRSTPWLKDLTAQPFLEFVDYILGKKVDRINTSDAPRPKPEWHLVLSYEFELRKEAFKRVRQQGATLAEALRDVIKDAELRALCFMEPLLAARSRHPPPPAPFGGEPSNKRQRQRDAKRAREGNMTDLDKHLQRPGQQQVWNTPPPPPGKGKGKGKKKSEGKALDPSLQLVAKTPDGRDICFLYNKGQCHGACSRVHVCRVKGCTHAGPAYEHPHHGK